MMKKILLALCMVAMFSTVAKAETFDLGAQLKKIPAIDNGVCFSLMDSQFNYSATTKLLQTKDERFALNVGYAGVAKNTASKLIATASVNLLKVSDYIDAPILKYVIVEPYFYAGYGSINMIALKDSEGDYGVGVNIVKLHF